MKLVLAAALSAAALFASDARAADSLGGYYQGAAPVAERVRTICDDYGRCWQERTARRVVIDQDDGAYYRPRERYVERRYYPDRPQAGVGVYTPNVTVDLDDDDDDDD